MSRRVRWREGASWNAIRASAAALLLVLGSGSVLAGGDPEAGAKVAETCQACHGPDGNSPSPLFPRLAGQYADYLLKTLEDYRSGERDNAVMKALVAQMSDQEMEDVSAFYASQPGPLFTIKLTR